MSAEERRDAPAPVDRLDRLEVLEARVELLEVLLSHMVMESEPPAVDAAPPAQADPLAAAHQALVERVRARGAARRRAGGEG
jgi:hypothetical protein